MTPISLSALVCGLSMIYHRIQSPNMIITHQAGARGAAADSSQHLTSLSSVSGDSWLRMTAACVLVRDASIFVLALCNTAANEGAVTSIGGGPLRSQCTLAHLHSGLYVYTSTITQWSVYGDQDQFCSVRVHTTLSTHQRHWRHCGHQR